MMNKAVSTSQKVTGRRAPRVRRAPAKADPDLGVLPVRRDVKPAPGLDQVTVRFERIVMTERTRRRIKSIASLDGMNLAKELGDLILLGLSVREEKTNDRPGIGTGSGAG